MQQQQEVLFPCSKCGENVSDDQRAISCDECGSWTHQVCVCREISRKRYERIIQRQEEFKFVCIKCRNLESTRIPKFLNDYHYQLYLTVICVFRRILFELPTLCVREDNFWDHIVCPKNWHSFQSFMRFNQSCVPA